MAAAGFAEGPMAKATTTATVKVSARRTDVVMATPGSVCPEAKGG